MASPNIEGTSNPPSLGGGVYGTLYVSEFTPVAVANGGTVNLDATQSLNVIRTTSDGTISGAVINLPVGVPNGFVCRFVTTGIVTTVTGTVSGATVLPVVSVTAAGVAVQLTWNSTLGLWFKS